MFFMNDNDFDETDKILICGECKKSASAAARLYEQRLPNRRAPADIIEGYTGITIKVTYLAELS